MSFEFEPTDIPDVLVVTAAHFPDARGYFLETFRESAFHKHGVDLRVAQVNESVSCARTVRGLHYQLEPHAQGKLVRVLRGSVLDVAVDIRRGSPHYGQHVAIELDADNGRMMWIPPGFAHGFCALTDNTHFLYLQTAEYELDAEAGFMPLDPELGIEWPFAEGELILSDKDRALPPLTGARVNFEYET